ncbi:YjgB family protein [Cohnella rhizosphaerae]|uniref:DUF4309 domain-containing protein n=1 Tax=Cohnella rhizosphaerae TaxID=1457232 RepID=A0A9X4L0I7_9BACL|nr:DUF4309 domain-containing protein [Cohnella rhizosphaerae]MDG0811224.1 DUF4309 domain-containing protein [Cohnella rhizosphaerae]
MNNRIRSTKICAAIAAGAVLLGGAGASDIASASAPAQAVEVSAASDETEAMVIKNLMTFYKPALKGQFPDFHAFTIGRTTHQDVVDAIGEPPQQRVDADGWDVYHAEMGHPGYALNYKLNKLREMRYFGTNVERQTNIGGITLHMLYKYWSSPDSGAIIKNGKLMQRKITYVRGDYKMEFIFNNLQGYNLDHINLTAN